MGMIAVFIAGIYLLFICFIFRAYNFWAMLTVKLFPLAMGIFLIIYSGMRIPFIANLFY